MKRILIALTLLVSLPLSSTLFAKNWEKLGIKLALGAHRANLNYSGKDDYIMYLHTVGKPNFDRPRHPWSFAPILPRGERTLIARDTYSYGTHLEAAFTNSKEITPNFGFTGELGLQLGIAGSLLDEGTLPALRNLYVSAGPCFQNDKLRLFVQGGVGIGIDFFGYPSVVDDLENNKEVQVEGNKNGFLNANVGFHWSITTGIEFATSSPWNFGLQYKYSHSFRTTTLLSETLDVSVHMLALTASK